MKPTIAPLLLALVKRVGIFIFLISFLQNGVEQFLTELIQSNLSSPNGATNIVWLYGALNMAVSILAPLIQTWLIFSALGSLLHLSPPSSSGRRNLYADLVKEQLRALGFIFWGFLLFIVPGFIRFFRYLFVPLVVSFDERYVRGQRDALRASAAVWRENRLKVLVYVFLIFGMIPLVLTLGDEWNKPFRLPLVSLPFQMMEALVVIWAHLLLFKMWRKTHDETLLSVE